MLKKGVNYGSSQAYQPYQERPYLNTRCVNMGDMWNFHKYTPIRVFLELHNPLSGKYI